MKKKDIYILGFSDSVHDKSVCIFKNNKPLVAIEEERITRTKHGLNLYYKSRKQPDIFSQMNLENSSSIENETKLKKMIDYCLEYLELKESDINIMIGNSLHNYLPFHSRAIYLNHHLAHASASYFSSGFDEAAIFITDGYGDCVDTKEFETIGLYYGKGNHIDNIQMVTGNVNTYYDMKNSLGVFYRIGTLLSGFGVFDEGKTMGLSSYGKPIYYNVIKKYIKYKKNYVEIDNKYLWEYLSNKLDIIDFQSKADIAKSFQIHLEEVSLFYLNKLYDLTKSRNLCIGGGVGLNCVANYNIYKKSPFENIHIFPASGDNGNSFGAAYYASHSILNFKRTPQLDTCFFGKKYTTEKILKAIEKNKSNISFLNLEENELIDKVAHLLKKNEIIFWFQGGSEFGPRALGHRSVIANPKNISIKDYINSKIKFREMFRPLAPIVLEEFKSKYFDFNMKSPFMLLAPNVKKKTKSMAEAIVHFDDTARVQTINKKQNARLYKIIYKFYKLSGYPIILNTSLNGKDEPIVETPDEAIELFLESPVKHLFIDNFYLFKY